MSPRGFFGIGVYHPKREVNVGTLWRHAALYGAQFIYTIGARYHPHQASDTTKAPLSIPLYGYPSFEAFLAHIPHGCRLVCVEQSQTARPLPSLVHPEQAVYLLGAEDHGLPESILSAHPVVEIPAFGSMSMNVAVAGSLVMYDRYVKATSARRLAVAS